MKKFVIVIIVLLIIGGGVFFFLKSQKKEEVKNYIETSGTMEVIETDCSFRIGGKIVELIDN